MKILSGGASLWLSSVAMIGFDVRLRHIPGVSTQAAHDLLQAAAMFFAAWLLPALRSQPVTKA